MPLFHWPAIHALHSMAAISAPALFAMNAFGPRLTIEFESAENADEATDDVIEIAEGAFEVVEEEAEEVEAEDSIEEATEDVVEEVEEELEDVIEVTEEAFEVVEEAIEEAIEEAEDEEEFEEAVEEFEEEEFEEAEEEEFWEGACWVTPSGVLYHIDPDCTYIHNKDTLTMMTVEEAENDGRRPCSRCVQ